MPMASGGHDPIVSIVIPLRNARGHVASLTTQLKPFVSPGVEILLVDDASDDDTMDQLIGLAGRIPSVRILSGTGQGVARARNLAVADARGEYVWFADADDTWSTSVLKVLLGRAKATQMDIVACNAQKIDDASGARLGLIEDAALAECIDTAPAMRRVLTGRLQGHLWNKLFRRSTLGEEPFPATRAHSDLGGVLGTFARANGVAMVPETLYSYRIRAGSILNAGGYRWEDLTDCLTIAIAAAGRLGIAGNDPAMRVFTCTQVVLPLVHETIRRRGGFVEEELREVRERARNLARLSDVKLLAAAGHQAAAARLLLILASPDAYGLAYAKYRRRRWSSLDRLAGTVELNT